MTDTTETPPVLELGTGFRDDEVTVLLDGRQVWHDRGVTTDYSVGLAAVVPLPPGGATVEVRVGDRAAASAALHTDAVPEAAPEAAPAAAPSGGRLRADLDPAGAMNIAPAPEGPIF